MIFSIKTKVISIIKNPIYAIGLIVMLVFLYMQCGSYLNINYMPDNSQIMPVDREMLGDADVMDGYIPMTEEEYFNERMNHLRDDLIEHVGMDEKKANELIDTALNMDQHDAMEYLEKECQFMADIHGYFSSGNGIKLGTVTEINKYIFEALDREDYMDYLGRKYIDYLGTIFMFFCIIIYPFYYAYDSKKDIYELLHTKPISSKKYIITQVLGGFLVGIIAVVVITLIAQGFLFFSKERFDFAISTVKIWKYTLWEMIPAIIYISSVFLFFSILFKTPLPAIPFIFIQILYSNSGVTSANGSFIYKHRIGSIMIRYPKLFFETHLSENFYVKQLFLLALGVIVMITSVVLWEKKRG